MRTYTLSDNEHTSLKGRTYITKYSLFRDEFGGLILPLKAGVSSTWQNIPKGTAIYIAAIVYRVLPDSGKTYYALCRYMLDGVQYEGELPLNRVDFEFNNLWEEATESISKTTVLNAEPKLKIQQLTVLECEKSVVLSQHKAGEIWIIGGIALVWISPGYFQMGSDNGRAEEQFAHDVCIKEGFWMSQTEVTFAQWDECVRADKCPNVVDEGWGRGNRPVINVGWDDIQIYLAWLNKKTNQQFQLPSEEEWEYAARAGTKTAYWWGDKASHEYANYGTDRYSRGFIQGKDQWEYTAPVGQFLPNPWGLYDMHGNASEWCENYWYDYDKDSAPLSSNVWRASHYAILATLRMYRGGSWMSEPSDLSSIRRSADFPRRRYSNRGFRVIVR